MVFSLFHLILNILSWYFPHHFNISIVVSRKYSFKVFIELICIMSSFWYDKKGGKTPRQKIIETPQRQIHSRRCFLQKITWLWILLFIYFLIFFFTIACLVIWQPQISLQHSFILLLRVFASPLFYFVSGSYFLFL